MRYIYLTSQFFGSAEALDAIAATMGKHQLVGIVVSSRPRGLPFIVRILAKAGVRYAAYLFLLGRGYRTLQRLARPPGERASHGPHDLDRVAKSTGARIIRCKSVREPELLAFFQQLAPDLVVSFYWDQLLPAPLRQHAKVGCLNIHNSLLPEFAGPAPTISALALGRDQVGVTVHLMNDRFDGGDIILQQALQVGPDESVLGVEAQLLKLGTRLLPEAVASIEAGVPPCPQDLTGRSYFTHPGRETLRRLRRGGRRLATLRDLRRLLHSVES